MAGHELFAVIFIFAAVIFAYVGMAMQFGLDEAIANKIVEFVDKRINKQKNEET